LYLGDIDVKGLYQTMTPLTWDSLLPLLNLELIAEKILKTEGRALENHEFDDVKELCIIAGRRWLARDLEDLQILGLEEEVFIDDIPGQRTPFHGFIDGWGVLTGKGTPTLQPYVGRIAAWDWKTTKNHVENSKGDWKQKMIDSWQWPIYSTAKDVRIFMYRGISTTYKTTEEVILQTVPTTSQEVKEYLSGVYAQRQSYVDLGLTVWPRRKPDSCNAFGRPCPYLTDCDEYTMPQIAPGDRQLSYSSANTLLLCPERHRRDSLTGNREETDSTVVGQAFHRGMQEMYEQGRKLVG
jgi:hypothetical protein